MILNSINTLVVAAALLTAIATSAQNTARLAAAEKETATLTAEARRPVQNVVVITGARFSYPLIEKWIDEYNKVNRDVQIIIESRGSGDPLQYDILAEVYEHDAELKTRREYINVGRYAILPVANSASSFARVYADKGLNADLIKQLYFNDIFVDQDKQKKIETPYTVYTRLQKAGVPAVFSEYFGHAQKDLKGVSIAGADAHLLKALLRDSVGVSYLPLPLIYDPETRKPVEGITVLPVDLNGNRKIQDDEKFYDTIDRVVETLEAREPGKINNVPIAYLHLSVDKQRASAEAIDFLKWVNEYGLEHLHTFGYLKPEKKNFEKEKFDEFATQRGR